MAKLEGVDFSEASGRGTCAREKLLERKKESGVSEFHKKSS